MNAEFTQRSIPIPTKRKNYFKNNWMFIYTPLVEGYDMQIRYNLQTNEIDLRSVTSKDLEKAAQFIVAITLGYAVDDAKSILKNVDFFIERFRIQDVKTLHNEHVNRARGRIIGTDGKVKNSIASASNTKIIVDDDDIFIIGTSEGIKLARFAICRLIMGSKPSKVCSDIGSVTGKLIDKFGMIEDIKDRIE